MERGTGGARPGVQTRRLGQGAGSRGAVRRSEGKKVGTQGRTLRCGTAHDRPALRAMATVTSALALAQHGQLALSKLELLPLQRQPLLLELELLQRKGVLLLVALGAPLAGRRVPWPILRHGRPAATRNARADLSPGIAVARRSASAQNSGWALRENSKKHLQRANIRHSALLQRGAPGATRARSAPPRLRAWRPLLAPVIAPPYAALAGLCAGLCSRDGGRRDANF